MGAEPKSLIRALRQNPDLLAWSIPREIQIARGPTGSLGIRFQTIQCISKDVHNTIVKNVYDSCIIKSGQLHKLDRIHKINGISLSDKTETDVNDLFVDKTQLVFNLEVQTEVLLQRTNSNKENSNRADFTNICVDVRGGDRNQRRKDGANMNGSSMNQTNLKPKRMLSNTSSVGKNSVERPPSNSPNKRFVKSNSTDTDEIPLSPCSANGCLYDLETDQPRMQSLPDRVSFAEIGIEIEEGERTNSLPVTNGETYVTGPGQLKIARCSKQNCNREKDKCRWHILIFRKPQFVVWDPIPKSVSLVKGGNPTYGIEKKLKILEATQDMYTLVDSVLPGSLAEEAGLHVGDWIRSVNGKALQSKEEARCTKFDHYTEIRLVIQRPEGILEKAEENPVGKKNLRQRNPRVTIPKENPYLQYGFPASPGHSPASPMVRSPALNFQDGHIYSQVRQVSPIVDQFGNMPLNIPRHGFSVNPLGMQSPVIQAPPVDMSSLVIRPVDPRSIDTRYSSCHHGYRDSALHSHPSSPRSPDCNCSPLYRSGSSSPQSPREGHIPSVRVIICGNAATDLAEMILAQSGVNQTLSPDQSFRFSLRTRENAELFMDTWQKWNPNSQNPLLSGQARRNGYQEEYESPCVNVELFAIQDENFFHHCSHILFTKDTVFLLAFNASKILTNMSSDIARLENLVHTIKSHVGHSATVKLYGVLKDHEADEVKSMFYANDKKKGKYSVIVEDICFISEMDRERQLYDNIFKHQQRKSATVELLSEILSGLETLPRTVWKFQDLKQYVGPQNIELHKHLAILEQTGCIKHVTEISDGHPSIDFFVSPVRLLKCLKSLCLDSKEGLEIHQFLILSTSGTMSRQELSVLLRDLCPDSEMLIQCLLSMGIIYETDDHNCPSVLIPYFLEEICDERVTSPGDLCLLAQFKEAVPFSVFYRLLSRLQQHPDCRQVKTSCARIGEVTMTTFCLSLHLDIMKDRIVISISRSTVRESDILQLILRILNNIVPRSPITTGSSFFSEPGFILGPPCPLGEPQYHEPGHAIDLQAPQIKCKSFELEGHTKVKKWLPADRQPVDDILSKNIYTDLPNSVFENVCDNLIIRQEWTKLADSFGHQTVTVEKYRDKGHATGTLPSRLMLLDWSRTAGQGTIRQLIDHLTQAKLLPARDIITAYVNEK